jgi:starch synthase
VDIVCPSYGFLVPEEAAPLATGFADFAGNRSKTALYTGSGKKSTEGVRHLLIDHPLFKSYDEERRRYRIYFDDPPESPFARDAEKFALFCSAVCAFLIKGSIEKPDIIHLHDWHAAFFLILAEFNPRFAALSSIRTVYTIHNLAIQGTRPFEDHPSSLSTWYPDLPVSAFPAVEAPVYPRCVNPMAATFFPKPHGD